MVVNDYGFKIEDGLQRDLIGLFTFTSNAMKFHNFAMPMYIPVEKHSVGTVDGLSNGYISPKLTELFKVNGTVSFISDIKREALESEFPVIEFGNSDNLINIKISRESIFITKNGETHTTGSRTFNVRHLTFTFEYYETNNTTIKIYDLDGEQIDIFTIPKKIDSFKIYANSIGTTNLAKISELKLWSRILSQQDIKKNIALGDGKTQIILDLLTYQQDEQFNHIKISPFILEYDNENNIILFKENNTMSIQSKKILPYGTSVVLYNGNKPLELGNKLDDVVADNKTLYEMLYPSELKYNADGTLSSNEYFQVKDYTLCKNITFGSSVYFPITQNDYNSYMQNNKQITCGFSHYGYLFILDKDIRNVQEGYGKDKIFGYKEYYENFLNTIYNPASDINYFIVGNYTTFKSYKPINTSMVDIYYSVYHPNEGYVIPLYNIYSYNYSTGKYELLVDRSSGDYYNRSNTLPYESVDLGGFDGKSLLIVVYKSNVVYGPRVPMIYRDGNTVYAKALVKAVTSASYAPPFYNVVTESRFGNIEINSSNTTIDIKSKRDVYSVLEENKISLFSQYKEESTYVYHKDRSLIKYQPSILQSDFNNVCNVLEYKNQYEHGTGEHNKFDLFGSACNAIYGNQQFLNKHNGLYINISNYPKAYKSTVFANEEVNFNEGIAFYDTSNINNGVQLIFFKNKMYAFRIYNDNGVYRYDGSSMSSSEAVVSDINKIKISIYKQYMIINGHIYYWSSIPNGQQYNKIFVPNESFIHEIYPIDFLSEYQTNYGLIESCIHYQTGDILISEINSYGIKSYDYTSNSNFIIARSISYNEFGRTFEQYSYKPSFPSSRFLRADLPEDDLLYMEKKIDTLKVNMTKYIINDSISKKYYLLYGNEYIIEKTNPNISYYRNNKNPYIENLTNTSNPFYITFIHPISKKELSIPAISYTGSGNGIKFNMTKLGYYTTDNTAIISSSNINNIVTDYIISQSMLEKVFHIGVDKNLVSNQSFDNIKFMVDYTIQMDDAIYVDGISMFQKSEIDIAYFEENDIDEVKMIAPSTTRIKYNNTIYNNISEIVTNKDIDSQFEVFGYNGLYFYRNTDFYILKRKYVNQSNLELRKTQVSKEIYLKSGTNGEIYYNNAKINEINIAKISSQASIGKFENKYRKTWSNLIGFNNNSADIVVSDSYDYITLSKESYNMNTNDVYVANTEIPKSKSSTTEICSIENNIIYIILCGYFTCGEVLLNNKQYSFPKLEYINILKNDVSILNHSLKFLLKGIEYGNIQFFAKDLVFNKDGLTFSLLRNIDTIKILLDIETPANNIFIQSSKLSIIKSVVSNISFKSFIYSIKNIEAIVYKADNNIIAKDLLKIDFAYNLGIDYNESDFLLKKNNNDIIHKTDTLNETSKNIVYELLPLNADGVTINRDLMSINKIIISFEKVDDVIRNVEIRKNDIAVLQNSGTDKYGFKIIKNNKEVEDINNSTEYIYNGTKSISNNDNIDILFYINSFIFGTKIEVDRYNIPIYDLEILASFEEDMMPSYFFDFYGNKYKEYDKISLKEKVSFGNVKGYKKIGISTDSIVFKNIKKQSNRMEICISRQLYDIDKNIPIEEQEAANFDKTQVLINNINIKRRLSCIGETKLYQRYYIKLDGSETINSLELSNFNYCDIMYIVLYDMYNGPISYYDDDILDENNFINIQIQDNEYIVPSASNYKWLETDTYPTRLEIANGNDSTKVKPHFSYGKFKIMNVIEDYPDRLFPFQKTYSIDNELYTNSIHNKTIENISVDPNFIDFNIFVQTIEDVDINNPILFVDDDWNKIDYSNVNHDYFYETDGRAKNKNVLFLIGEENESLDLYDSKSYLYKRKLQPYQPTINPMQLIIGSQLFFLDEVSSNADTDIVYIDGYKFQKGRVYINDLMSPIVDNHYEYEFCRTVKNISELISSYEFSNGCSNENSEIYKTKRDNGSIEISTDKYYLFNKFNSDRLHIDKGCAVYLYEGNKHMPILKDTMFIENIVSNIKLESVSISLKSKMDFIYDIKVINYNTYENIDVLSCIRHILKPYFLYNSTMCRMSAASKTILEDISKITSINPLSYQTIGEIIDAICSCGIFIWFNEIEQICVDYDIYNKNIYEYKNSLYTMLYENSPNAFNYINDTSYGVHGMKAIDKIDLNGYNYLENDIVVTERDDLTINTYELTHQNTIPMYDRNEYVIENNIYPVNNINLASNNKTNNQEILEYQTNQLKPKLIELDVTKDEFNSMKLKTGVMCVVRRGNIDLSYKFIQANKI